MSARVCRWGILGTAQIARKNWRALALAENATLAAVASRDRERSRAFIAECQGQVPLPETPRALGSYEELLEAEDIDALYIPLPTGIRNTWVRQAVEAGKHVLAEKPAGLSSAEVEEVLAACREYQVQFMDGVMFMHSARLERIRQVLDDDVSVGRIKRITSHHAFHGDESFLQENIRLHSGLEPQGCLGDLGWYSLRFILWAVNWQIPERVSGRILSAGSRADSPGPVPTEFSGELFFRDGLSASFYCSFLTENQQWVNVGGTRGFLRVPDFVLPFFGNELAFDVTQAVFNVAGCDFNMEHHGQRHTVAEYATGAADSQETNLIRNFSNLVLSKTPDYRWGQFSLLTQQVMDACLQSARQDGATLDMRLE